MTELFSNICNILFTFNDGSTIQGQVTLNPSILEEHGYSDIDGLIDLSSGRLIPEDLFNMDFVISVGEPPERSKLDQLFDIGGKIHWSLARS